MAGAVDKLMPALLSLVPKPSSARQGVEDAEKTSAKLAASSDLRRTCEEIVETIAENKAKPEINTWYVGVLEKKLAAVQKRMETDADEVL